MRLAHSLVRCLAVGTAVLMSVSLVLALSGLMPGETPPAISIPVQSQNEPCPLFANPISALNESVLILQADERGVYGWVAGKTKAEGVHVRIRAGGVMYETAVRNDNTFVWEHTTNRNLSVIASLTLANGKKLTARTTLLPAPSTGGPTIFFVTDRSAYRPGHTVKFAAFLRTLLPSGEFVPVGNREATIDLTSATKQTRAARLKLKSDEFGRITGEYTFSEADALDHYFLSAEGFSGDAKVFLSEYRKSKVGMKLTGEIKDGKLVVTFDARDYLDRPVKGNAASYVATVSRTAEPEKLTLKSAAFAKQEGGPPTTDDLDVLPDDERLLALANGVSVTTFAGFGSRVVGTREGKASVSDNGGAKLELDLKPEWLNKNHALTISGVFTDETGRENRATATFKLDPRPARGVRVSTKKDLFTTGEKIPINFTTFGLDGKEACRTTLVLVQLVAQTETRLITVPPGYDVKDDFIPEATMRLPALNPHKPQKSVGEGWSSFPVYDPVKRVIHSVIPIAGNAAEVSLKQPGAYKFLAVTLLADGTTVESEAGVLVKAPAQLPGLVLHLDHREFNSESHLTGRVDCRFAGAKLLLTLRDSTGIKLTRTLTSSANGMAMIDEPLPANLRYGCSLCVEYPESTTTIHADQRELFVIPHDRTIKVAASVPPEFGPGEEVPLQIQVDRQEETDLIVSVYDDSLLGVTGDLSKDIRDFFLADVRGQSRAAHDLAVTRAGKIPVAKLVKKAEALLQSKEALEREADLEGRLENLLMRWRDGELAVSDVIVLVRLAGLEVYLARPVADATGSAWKVSKHVTLAELLQADRKETAENMQFYISSTLIGNVVLLGVATRKNGSPTGSWTDPWLEHRDNAYTFRLGYTGQIGLAGQFGFQGQYFNHGGYQFSGYSGLGGGFGYLGQANQGFGAGFSGIGGGQFGFGGGFGSQPSGNTIHIGIQGSYSHPGGQMGMSFGSNRDFAAPGVPGFSTVGPLPALGIGQEMVRRDFADSAFWSAKLRTDKSGKAAATFKVPDSLTNWRVQVTAISSKMHVGTGTATFKTSRSIMIWPMLPRTFTEGDVVRVFGTVHNLTDMEQSIQVRLSAGNGQVLDAPERKVVVPAKANVPVYWTYRAGIKGFTDLLMSAKCEAGSDASLKKLPVTCAAVLERSTVSGLVGKGKLTITLPADFDPARASAAITIAPTLAADLADTLPYLVEYPYGCVEQTMSRFLPAIRVAQILRQSGLITLKDLEAKLPKVVEAGQKRLIELQHPDGGWGWQGNGATHEMMTPYALYGLIQAEELSLEKNPNRIQGKLDRKQLYQLRAGDNFEPSFRCPNPQTIESGMARLRVYLEQMLVESDRLQPLPPGQTWPLPSGWENGRPSVMNDAVYSLWVFGLRCDDQELEHWWTRIDNKVGTVYLSDYGHALALELAVKKGKKELADKLVSELRKRAKKSGDQVYWTTAGFSHWGDNVTEITAASMKALVAYDPNDPLIPGILAFFYSTKRGDRWDSTKDTACVLYALCDYLAAIQVGAAATGLVKVSVNGEEEASTLLDKPISKVITLNDKNLKPGENILTMTGPETSCGALARAVVSFTRGRGAEISAQDYGVNVQRTLSLRSADGKWSEFKSGATIPTGSYVKVRVSATPAPGTNLQFTLMESPKPAGGETVPVEDTRFPSSPDALGHVLREDREAMTCFHYENADGTIAAEYVVMMEFAGGFQIAPARVELMYKPTVGGHSSSFVLNVSEKKQEKR